MFYVYVVAYRPTAYAHMLVCPCGCFVTAAVAVGHVMSGPGPNFRGAHIHTEQILPS